eukprot:764389-Hanusia_phi.AAC.2
MTCCALETPMKSVTVSAIRTGAGGLDDERRAGVDHLRSVQLDCGWDRIARDVNDSRGVGGLGKPVGAPDVGHLDALSGCDGRTLAELDQDLRQVRRRSGKEGDLLGLQTADGNLQVSACRRRRVWKSLGGDVDPLTADGRGLAASPRALEGHGVVDEGDVEAEGEASLTLTQLPAERHAHRSPPDPRQASRKAHLKAHSVAACRLHQRDARDVATIGSAEVEGDLSRRVQGPALDLNLLQPDVHVVHHHLQHIVALALQRRGRNVAKRLPLVGAVPPDYAGPPHARARRTKPGGSDSRVWLVVLQRGGSAGRVASAAARKERRAVAGARFEHRPLPLHTGVTVLMNALTLRFEQETLKDRRLNLLDKK